MAWIPLAASAIQAAGSIGGGLLAGNANKESKMQRTQRKLVDSLLASLTGNGPYSDLFASDENAFMKSFVNPARQRFQNQIAPMIQQQYLANGQQRGSGMSDQLLRAGVDLNSLLDQHYMDFLQQAQNRKANTISSILGAGAGAPPTQSFGQNLSQAGAGYLSSDAFQDLVSTGKDYFMSPSGQRVGGGSGYSYGMDAALQPRRGFQKPLEY